MNNPSQSEEYQSSVNIQSFMLFLFATTFGLLVAVVVLPVWMPNLAFSISDTYPKAFWYVSRATAFVSLSLLWLSMALGLGITNKMARLWPGAPATFAIHEYVSLLGLAFAVFHALVLLGDHYINFTLAQVLMPFSTANYRPFWVGVGQLGFYIWVIVAFSFYIRSMIGQKTWRLLHYLSFGMYVMGIFHGLFSGTDASAGWAHTYYWISFGSLLFLFFVRIVGMVIDKLFPQRPAPRQGLPSQPVAPEPITRPASISAAAAASNSAPKTPLSTGMG
jgi:predicted ferric reductase